jgi:UrcA family protein
MLKLFCAAGACLVMASPANAASAPAPAERAVSTAGVDFRDPAAVRQLYAQLQVAAEAVCDSYAANSRVTQADVACVDKALARVVRKLDRSQLTAIYEGRASTRLADRR